MNPLRSTWTPLALLLLTLVAGCSKPQDKLVGTWVVDIDAIAESADIKKLEPAQRKDALALATKMMSGISWQFSRDGRVTQRLGQLKTEGRYEVKSASKNSISLSVTTKRPDEPDRVDEIHVKVVDGALELTGADGKTLRLVRQ